MLDEVIHYLNCRPGKTYTDCTLGGSGHARAICERIMPDGLFIGIDQDIDAITNAQKTLQPYSSNSHLFHGNFINLPQFLAQIKIDAVDGILLDLGLSLHQLENSGRGFSFNKDEPVDMRMDNRSATRAGDLVNNLAEQALRKIFKDFGEERWSKQIARSIVKNRRQKKIQTSRQLAQIVRSAIPRRAPSEQRIHPATRVFMALRIAVNKELEMLDRFMAGVSDWLNPKGRPKGSALCFIVSFAGGSHCQTTYQNNGKRMHLSTEITRMRMWQKKCAALADKKGGATGPKGNFG
jgi:16S rRNA (cytosine1402-N4)-methyltransferase